MFTVHFCSAPFTPSTRCSSGWWYKMMFSVPEHYKNPATAQNSEFSSHFSCCDLSTLAVPSSCTRALQCPNIFHQSLWLCNNKGSTFHPAILTRWEPQHWDISTAASPAQSLQYRDTWSVNRWGWDLVSTVSKRIVKDSRLMATQFLTNFKTKEMLSCVSPSDFVCFCYIQIYFP